MWLGVPAPRIAADIDGTRNDTLPVLHLGHYKMRRGHPKRMAGMEDRLRILRSHLMPCRGTPVLDHPCAAACVQRFGYWSSSMTNHVSFQYGQKLLFVKYFSLKAHTYRFAAVLLFLRNDHELRSFSSQHSLASNYMSHRSYWIPFIRSLLFFIQV
jgi:hypothetical protein